jgi:tRNA(His) 5'-end guanylyltransferase
LCQEAQGVKLAYGQSDEISILLTDYDTFTTEPWFNGKVQKIVSVAASVATLAFNADMRLISEKPTFWDDHLWCKLDRALFDARVFSIPREDVVNYFVWRQQDAVRNSVQMLARSHFSHKETMNLNCDQLQEKLWQEKKVNWNDSPTVQKRGWAIMRQEGTWMLDEDIPTFTQDRDFIEKLVCPEEPEEV